MTTSAGPGPDLIPDIVPRPTNGVWPSSGPAIVDYVGRAFPQYLVVTATDDERIANMEFLRDRIIETGVCGGLLLARNLKRGIGPHSIDALAWRDGLIRTLRNSGVLVLDVFPDDVTPELVKGYLEIKARRLL